MKSILKLSVSAILLATTLVGCNNSTSYAELLNDETKAINNYLADQQVKGVWPGIEEAEIGIDAPFYRMDDDGLVYMRVISKGDMDNMAKDNDVVYIRFMRYNLFDYKDGDLGDGDGNAEDVSYDEQFRFHNYNATSSVTWGEGIQLPLDYLGYECQVELVMRSQTGRSDEISYVQPYLYNVRYFKSRT
ncbi:MAG: DUF4827 domain-containing protein [Muribaculum sp.]|nr:DUF4827 domain-containing protein [Muribaculum sp.]